MKQNGIFNELGCRINLKTLTTIEYEKLTVIKAKTTDFYQFQFTFIYLHTLYA